MRRALSRASSEMPLTELGARSEEQHSAWSGEDAAILLVKRCVCQMLLKVRTEGVVNKTSNDPEDDKTSETGPEASGNPDSVAGAD